MGDTVFTRSDTDFTDQQNKITQLLRRQADGYYEIVAGTETIKVTPEHPFWRQGEGWVKAEKLKPGDPIVAAAGDVVVRQSKYIKGPVSVYNFSVEVNHNYFVSEHKLWVHNEKSDTLPCGCKRNSCTIPTHVKDEKSPDAANTSISRDSYEIDAKKFDYFHGNVKAPDPELKTTNPKKYDQLKHNYER